jgi:hypothetical protein
MVWRGEDSAATYEFETRFYDRNNREKVRERLRPGGVIEVSEDQGDTWRPFRDNDGDGRDDTADYPDGVVHPANQYDSQPVDGAPDKRDYWCEAGVTNPDGPNGERRDQPKQRNVTDLMQPGRNAENGVIIERNPPPTPQQLKDMVSQPGVDGSVQGANNDGPRQPAASRFAQPPRGGNGLGRNGTGTGMNDAPVFTPKIPKPIDPELVQSASRSRIR